MSEDLSLEAQIGCGTIVKYRLTGSAAAWKELDTLVSIDGPGDTPGEVEATRLKDLRKRYKQTRPEGEITFNIQHIGSNTSCQDFAGWSKGIPANVDLQVTYPDGEVDSLSGFPKGYAKSGIEGDTIIMAAISFRVNTASTAAPPVTP